MTVDFEDGRALGVFDAEGGSGGGLGIVLADVESRDIGGGVDVVVNDTISIRPAQFDLLMSRFSFEDISLWESMFRYSAGIVFKFGSK